MPIRILIVDDHRLMREGLASLLDVEEDLEVVGQAHDGRQAIEMARTLRPDVVVLDIAMPGLNGVDATRRIRSDRERTQVLALTLHNEHRFVVDMLQAGATGYLPKSCAFDELASAIRHVHGGRMYLSPAVTGSVVQGFLDKLGNGETADASPLTPREREVLQLVAEGKSSKEIAAALHVSVNTVIRHRQKIMDRLEIRTVAELTKYAIREGLCDLR